MIMAYRVYGMLHKVGWALPSPVGSPIIKINEALVNPISMIVTKLLNMY